MKLGNLSKLVTALTVATTFQLFSVAKLMATDAFKIIGLTPNNVLVSFGSDNPDRVRVTGIGNGNLQCIDFRPANGKLYGFTDTDRIYTINPNTGVATLVSTLNPDNRSFNGGFQSGCDFNPVVDRLRIVGSNNQNFRVNVDTGEIAEFAPGIRPDRPLAYATRDPNARFGANITAAAYDNSRTGATLTELYGIDYDLDVLVEQDPPNDGTLNTIGSLGFNFAPLAGFDISTDKAGKDNAFALSGSTLYTINLETGAAKKLGNMPSRSGYIGLAVTVRQR